MTLNRELNEKRGQQIADIKFNPDIMRVFTCFIDFRVDMFIMIDVLRKRQPNRNKQLQNIGDLKLTETLTDINNGAAAASSSTTTALAPAPPKSFVIKLLVYTTVLKASRNQPASKSAAFASSTASNTSSLPLGWRPNMLTPVMLALFRRRLLLRRNRHVKLDLVARNRYVRLCRKTAVIKVTSTRQDGER